MMLHEGIDGIRRSIHRAVIIRNGATFVASVLMILAILVFLDWIFRFTTPVRLLTMITIVLVLVCLTVRYILPGIAFNPSRVEVAHRIGRFVPADDGRIASAVQFTEGNGGSDDERECIEYAEREIDSLPVGRMIRSGPLIRWSLVASILLIGWSFFIITQTESASTGLVRIIVPTSDAAWPSRTSVSSLMEIGEGAVHGRGTVLLMRARNDTEGDPSGPVRGVYREYVDGEPSEWNEILMTHQGDGVHERIITPTGDRLDFRFSTGDSTTEIQTITVKQTPRVLDARMTITPPGYLDGEPEIHEPTGPVPGFIPPPVLERSGISLTIVSNNDLGLPEDHRRRMEWLSDVLVEAVPDGMEIGYEPSEPDTFHLRWVATDTSEMTFLLRDVDGLVGVDAWGIDVEVVADLKPVITIEIPDRDIAVLPTAVVPIRVRSSDDLGVDRVVVEVGPEHDDATPSSESLWSTSSSSGERTHELATSLDLNTIPTRVGTRLRIDGSVVDTYRESGSMRRIDAAPRRVEIIDRSTLLSSIRSRFDLLQRRIRDLDAIQDRLQRVSATGSWTAQEEREQASLTRSIQDQISMLDTIRSRMEMNRLTDVKIESLLRMSGDSLESASALSESAVEAMGTGDRERTITLQSDVRFEFSEIVALLGEDQESWLVERMIEDIIIRQENILDRSSDLRDEFIGLRRESMNDGQSSTIDDLAREQRSLIDSVRELERSLRERSDTLSSTDPRTAESMNDAAGISERMRVEENMRDAAEQISRAQMQNAATSQQSALDALRGMRKELNDGTGVEVEDLVRIFEELNTSIERLIQTQKREISRFETSIIDGVFSNLDTRMIRLRTNTLSVAGRAESGGEMSRDITDRLIDAAGFQASAIMSLRASPVPVAKVGSDERGSLDQLLSALELSRKRMEEVLQDNRSGGRGELETIYRELAAQQADIVESSGGMVDANSDRRTRFMMRQLARRQEQVRVSIREVAESNDEVADNMILMHVHDRIDDLCTPIVTGLRDGAFDSMMFLRQQMVMDHLVEIAESLRNGEGDGRFAESGSSSGSGTDRDTGSTPSEQGSVPPIAELRLLRSLQASLLSRTKRIESISDLSGADRTFMITDMATQQESLAELGLSMIETLRDEGIEKAEDGSSADPVIQPPPSMNPVTPNQATSDPSGEGLADLDELLGLDPESDIAPDEGGIDVPDDVPQGLDVLVNAVRGMNEAARRLGIESTGVQTQRIQQDVIDELDRLIENADRQQRNSSGSSESMETNPGSMDRQQTDSSSDPSESDGGRIVLQPEEPNLSGPIDEIGSEWGALPDRVRRMLQQGRRDEYSSLYEQMTTEYYRRLARESRRESSRD